MEFLFSDEKSDFLITLKSTLKRIDLLVFSAAPWIRFPSNIALEP